jgi:hypothetical protein
LFFFIALVDVNGFAPLALVFPLFFSHRLLDDVIDWRTFGACFSIKTSLNAKNYKGMIRI